MIPYEELDRALARWKSRAAGTVSGPVVTAPSSGPVTTGMIDAPPAMAEEDMATPLPIPSEELGSIPNAAAPGTERTGEIDVDELEAYEEEEA
jgi:hypothetical protein